MRRNWASLILFLSLTLVVSGCATTHSYFEPEFSVSRPSKIPEAVEYFTVQPTRYSVKLGDISVGGNGIAQKKHMIEEAKLRAGRIGGDYVLLEDEGVDISHIVVPSQTSYEEKAAWNKDGGAAQSTGNERGQCSYTVRSPWAKFSVWAYSPSHLGIKLQGQKIIGFKLNSPAETSGLQIGDEIIGIDDMDIEDQATTLHLMGIYPNDIVKISVRRDTQRIDYCIKAIAN